MIARRWEQIVVTRDAIAVSWEAIAHCRGRFGARWDSVADRWKWIVGPWDEFFAHRRVAVLGPRRIGAWLERQCDGIGEPSRHLDNKVLKATESEVEKDCSCAEV